MAKKRGIGLAAVWYPTGMSGGGDPSQAMIKMQPDGSVDVIIGSVDIGEGARTVVRQIAAEELGVPLDKVSVSLVDTDSSPLDTGTFASRITHQTGNAVIQAAREARQVLFEVAAGQLGVDPDKLIVKDDTVLVRDRPEQAIPIADVANHATWAERRLIAGRGAFGWPPANVDPVTGEGEPLHTMAYGATVAEVEVDTETGEVKVLKLVSAYDCGKAINPLLVEGQIDGGAAMGLGSALLEELHPYYPTLDHYPTGFFSYMVPTPLWRQGHRRDDGQLAGAGHHKRHSRRHRRLDRRHPRHAGESAARHRRPTSRACRRATPISSELSCLLASLVH
jgi:CO/xanthine dehydrogenase Mo-binding subunit